MGGLGATGVIIVAIALLWVAIFAALSFIAERRFRLAQTILDIARGNATLLEISPARPMIIRNDWRIEADAQLIRDLGLGGSPRMFADLEGKDSGLAGEDLASLRAQIEVASASASTVSAKVRVQESSRIFDVRGGPAPAPEPAGTLLLWFFDMSAGEE